MEEEGVYNKLGADKKRRNREGRRRRIKPREDRRKTVKSFPKAAQNRKVWKEHHLITCFLEFRDRK